MRKIIKWTKNEVGLLTELYPVYEIKYCSKMLNKTSRAITTKAYKLGLKRNKFIDLTGKKFGKLTAIKPTGKDKWGNCEWLCKCICGKEKLVSVYNLINKYTKSCGCLQKEKMKQRLIDLTGQKFNRLTPIKYLDDGKWLCKCDCGNEKEIDSSHMKNGHTKSCGCLNRETINHKNTHKDYWTKNEINILKEFYPDKGVAYCSNLLNRKIGGIRHQAKKLGLKINFVGKTGMPQKNIIKRISKNKIISMCKIHGKTIHGYYNNKICKCFKCRNIKAAQYRKIPINKFANRLRSLIRGAFKKISGTNCATRGAFRNLDYSPTDLYNYLYKIQQLQNNRCPICQTDYKNCIVSIDHIVPLATAKTEQQIIDLFCLKNLSLMCKNCNASKNDTNYNTWREKKCL